MFTEYQEFNTEKERYIPFSNTTLSYIDLALRDVCVCTYIPAHTSMSCSCIYSCIFYFFSFPV